MDIDVKKRKVLIIGSGQIGSRHLQALKAVKFPLDITVIDKSEESLRVAKERYKSMPDGKLDHKIEYLLKLPEKIKAVDIAIIATNSAMRASVTEDLLKKAKVKFLILEKLLFTKREDYKKIGKLLKNKGVQAWVNCSMRMTSFYRDLKKEFNRQNLTYILHGNQSGLAPDLIHHLDFIAYLTGSKNFSLDTSLLDRKTKPSKRKGYLEITGTLMVKFQNGSTGLFRCDDRGLTPKIIEILSQDKRYIIREYESRATVSRTPDWQWQEIEAPIPYQSQLTTVLAEELIAKGECDLPSYEESSKYHLLMLEPLLKFLNKISKKKYNYYPFT